MKTTFVGFVIIVKVLFLLGSGKACGPSEYQSAAGECCPMCAAGSVVRSDCSGDLSTTCRPCAPGTFMNQPNGLYDCLPCKNCDKIQGIYIQKKCTTIENTICDVLDGYYCIQESDSQCTHAVKHRVCEKGQERTPGTKTSDTVCVNCPDGFYSPSGVKCTKWTDCATKNEIQIKSGSSVRDVTCQPKREQYGLTGVPVVFVLSVIVLYFLRQSTSNNLKPPVEETSPKTSQPKTPEEQEE